MEDTKDKIIEKQKKLIAQLDDIIAIQNKIIENNEKIINIEKPD